MKRKKAAALPSTEAIEFCEVCNRHHEDGQRHKYFPKHRNALSAFLSRFQSKLSDVRFFLRNPTVLLPEHAARNRLWCVFCDLDIDEIGSSFACSKVIRHLASCAHLKSLKCFLWKNGGGMDQVDSFVISEAGLAKWEMKCNLMQKGSLSTGEASKGVTYGPPNDIQKHVESVGIDKLDHFTMCSDGSNNSSGVVMPLLRYTNENYQVWTRPQMDQTVRFESGYLQNGACSSFQHVMHSDLSSSHLKHDAGFRSLEQICPAVSVEAPVNVHTGAPPPWLEPTNNQDDSLQGSGAHTVKPSQRFGKSCKLNPKRVGAAWAEKRKIEMEMEKRGEIIATRADDNWLPNFGGVWHAGSRKESRKEFEMEKQKVSEVISQSELPVKIQPYVSKRTRIDTTSTG